MSKHTILVITLLLLAIASPTLHQASSNTSEKGWLKPVATYTVGGQGYSEIRAVDDYDGDGLGEAILVNSTGIVVIYSSAGPYYLHTTSPPILFDNISHVYIVEGIVYSVSGFMDYTEIIVFNLSSRDGRVYGISLPGLFNKVTGFVYHNNTIYIYYRLFDRTRFTYVNTFIKLDPLTGLYSLGTPSEGPLIYRFNVVSAAGSSYLPIETYRLPQTVTIEPSGQRFTISTSNWSVTIGGSPVFISYTSNYILAVSREPGNIVLQGIDMASGSIVYTLSKPLVYNGCSLSGYGLYYNTLYLVYTGETRVLITYIEISALIEYYHATVDKPIHTVSPIGSENPPSLLYGYRGFLWILDPVNNSTHPVKWLPEGTTVFSSNGVWNYRYIYTVYKYRGKLVIELCLLDTNAYRDTTPPSITIYSPGETLYGTDVTIDIAAVDNESGVYSLYATIYSLSTGDTVYSRYVYTGILRDHITLSPGYYRLFVNATNNDGVSSNRTLFIQVNPPAIQKPYISILSPGNWSITNSTDIMLKVNIVYPRPIGVSIYVNGSFYERHFFNGTMDIPLELDGPPCAVYNITVYSNRSRATLYVIIDREPPTLVIVEPANSTRITGIFNISFVSIDRYPEETMVYIDSDLVKRIPGANGFYSFRVNPWVYGNGPHTITIISIDKAGNTVCNTTTVYFDLESPPQLYLDIDAIPRNNSVVKGILELVVKAPEYSEITILIREARSDVERILWRGYGSPSGVIIRVNTSKYIDSTYSIEVVACFAGATVSRVLHYVFDNNPPSILLSLPWPMITYGDIVPSKYVSGPQGHRVIRGIRIYVTDYTVSNTTVTVFLNSRVLDVFGPGNTSYAGNTIAIPLEIPVDGDGLYNLTIKAVDAAGHISSVTHRLIVDLKPPTIVGLNRYIVTRGKPAIYIKARDTGTGINTSYIVLNGTIYPIEPYVTKKLDLDEGIWIGYVIVVDKAGNIANETITIVVDRKPPAITIAPPTPHPTEGMIIRVTVEDRVSGINTVIIDLNGDQETISVEGQREFIKTIKVGPGNIEIKVVAWDKAGNKAVKTDSFYIEENIPTTPGTATQETREPGTTPTTTQPPETLQLLYTITLVVASTTIATLLIKYKKEKTK